MYKKLNVSSGILGCLALFSMALSFTQPAQAVTVLDPTTITGNVAQADAGGHTNIFLGTCTTCNPDAAVYTMQGTSNPNAADIMAITGSTNTTLLYKDNAPGSDESGSFQSSYTTVFGPDSNDPLNADITWDGGPFITTAQWLEVKDGNQIPSIYLFDISGWDGKMLIDMNNFWPNQGAISHVSIWGTTVIPLPAAFPLFGTGLGILGFLGWRRRRQAQAV